MLKNQTLTFLLLFTLVMGACKPQATASAKLSASLSDLAGRVEARQAGQEAFTPATTNSKLEVNGQVQTGEDGRVRLDLSSGTIIRVAPSSLFTLTSNDEVEGGLATKIKLEIGKVFIILNGGSADVDTPSGVASVRGSYMKVEVDPVTLDVFITCLEGNCSASNPAGTVNFTQGQKTVLFQKDPVTGNWTIPNVEPMTPEEFQEWLVENPEAQEVFSQAIATITALAEPTDSPAPTAEPPATQTTVPTQEETAACFQIIQPASGSSLPAMGKVTFEWESQTGAQKYLVTFTDTNGNHAVIETTETSMEKYIEILPAGGEFSWIVTSFGADGSEICTTESASFSKPQSEPTPRPTQEKEPKETEPAATCDPFYGCGY